MKAVDNLKAVLTKSATAWISYAGASAALLFEFGLGQELPGWAVAGLLVLVIVARSIKQESVSGSKPEEEEVTFV